MTADGSETALVGRVARAHGLRGQVIVNAETDFPDERFRPGAEMLLARPNGAVQAIRLTTVRFHKDRPVIGIEGVGDMNGANALAGSELRVPVSALAALDAGMFYRHDLVGCVVETEDGTRVGIVAAVEGTLTGSRLVVRRDAVKADGAVSDVVSDDVKTVVGRSVGRSEAKKDVKAGTADVLVPLATAICTTIDPASKRIVIRPPAGLLDLNG